MPRLRSPEPEPQAVLRLADPRVFSALLGAIRAPTRPQHCALNITPEGLALAWQDPSKAARSSLYLGRDAFSKFDVPGSWGGEEDDDGDNDDDDNSDGTPGGAGRGGGGGGGTGGGRATVDLHTFADTAALFAALGNSAGTAGFGGSGGELELRYPGPNGEIEFEMGNSSSSSSSTSSSSSVARTYARVGTADTDPADIAAAAAAAAEDAAAAAAASRALRGAAAGGNGNGGGGGGGTGGGRGGCSVFIAPSALLREAVSDLEWAAGAGGGGGGASSSSSAGGGGGGGTVSLTLVRDPPRASLSARCVAGSLSVDLPPSALSSSFAVGGTLVRHGYRFRHLRSALAPPFASVPSSSAAAAAAGGGGGGGGGGHSSFGGGSHRHHHHRSSDNASASSAPTPPASSKVAVDSAGVLRVTHIVPLPRSFGGIGVGTNGSAVNAVIQFVTYSCVEEEEEEEEAEEEGVRCGNGGGGGGRAAVAAANNNSNSDNDDEL